MDFLKLHRVPFTVEGFKKVKMPKELYKKLLVWYLQNEKNSVIERHRDGGILGVIKNVNKGMPCTKIIPLSQNKELYSELTQTIHKELETWSGVNNLVHTSTYGIRTYERGDVLITHKDRPETHIVSAICNIYQEDMDEPWGLHIKDPDGWFHEIFMEPGEMIFYESDIMEHGRIYPLKGNSYSNIFIHFKPADYSFGVPKNSKVDLNPLAWQGFHNAQSYQLVSHKNEPNNIKRFEKVLTKTDCKNLIKEYSNFVQARTHSGNKEYDKEIRKAQNAVYEQETPLLTKVREIIAEKTGTHISQQEYPISIIKYEEGGEYKPHHDHWEHGNPNQFPQMGNRWKTAIIYLNDDYDGGETHFPNWDVKVKGKIGELVTWTNLNKNRTPNTDTLHAGLPVVKGTKYIIVSWIREFPYTPQTIKI